MADDVSPDVDNRSIDDIVTKMMSETTDVDNSDAARRAREYLRQKAAVGDEWGDYSPFPGSIPTWRPGKTTPQYVNRDGTVRKRSQSEGK